MKHTKKKLSHRQSQVCYLFLSLDFSWANSDIQMVFQVIFIKFHLRKAEQFIEIWNWKQSTKYNQIFQICLRERELSALFLIRKKDLL